MRLAWTTSHRAEVTFSLPEPDASERAAFAVRSALDAAGYGYTVRQAVGAWRGQYERTYTVSLVGASDAWQVAVHAAHAAGCSAVQVERMDDSGRTGYACEEWRPS